MQWGHLGSQTCQRQRSHQLVGKVKSLGRRCVLASDRPAGPNPGMALFGQIPLVKKQITLSAGFVIAFDYVNELLKPGSEARRRITSMQPGDSEKLTLDGGVLAIEQVYYTKSRDQGFFESHKKYIDVQVIVEGVEGMEVADISHLMISEPYLDEKDLIKYADTNTASVLRLGNGGAAIFYPTDGHMPTLQLDDGPKLVRKTVVKVPVA